MSFAYSQTAWMFKSYMLIAKEMVDIKAGSEEYIKNDVNIEKQIEYKKENKRIKVLAIGNSFSQDASKYLHDIADAGGIDLTVANLYIGGCTLETHWHNASRDLQEYDYELNGEPTGRKVSIKEALESDEWNYVTFQQASHDSGLEDTYYPYIEELAKYVKQIRPEAELLIHQTWAYEKGSDHPGFKNYNFNQDVMFKKLKSAYHNASVRLGLLTLEDEIEISTDKKPVKIIPSGQAMQNARAFPEFDTTYNDSAQKKLIRDGFHASLTYGRYLLGAVWYECLTGKKIADNSFSPEGISQNDLALLKKAAHHAVEEYGWNVE